MGGELSHIKRCLDLQEPDIVAAIGARTSTRALLDHLSVVSAPNTGVAKVLLVFARMATTACDWIDGELAIDLVTGEGDATIVNAATDLGGGLRERLLPPLTFRAPMVEFTRAIERVPHMIAPLSIQAKSAKRVLLTATAMVRRTSFPPAPFAISTESLFVPVPAPPARATDLARDLPPPLPLIATPKSEVPAARSVSDPPVEDLDSGWDE
jgi:hypothetical protein